MDVWNPKPENAIAAIRVSSVKQGLQGDSPEAQKEQIEQFARTHNITIKKFFVFMESASKSEQPVQEAIDYCKSPQNDIQFLIVKSIDRFTRGGSYFYDHLKMQLIKYGVKLVDIYGVISNQEINTLDHLDMQYSWSVYSPSKKSELLEAERAKDEIRDILTRLIGSEIRYTRLGYRCSIAPFGYVNTKVETQHGKRVILTPHPKEAAWIKRMFELRIRGDLTDREIVSDINKLGFKTRRYFKRHPNDKTKVVGIKGESKLSMKQFWRYIQDPVYAGITIHKWTKNKPVKGQFEGLVSIDMFNQANRGKTVITEENGEIIVQKDIPNWQLKKTVRNPNFPYRRYVLCPLCKNFLFGSASTGKSGKRFPAYHCNKRGHYFRVPKKQFEQTIHDFVKNLHITKDYVDALKQASVSEWQKRMKETKNDTLELEKKIEKLKLEQAGITEKIKILSSEVVLKALEKDSVKLEKEIKTLEKAKEEREGDYINMEIIYEKIETFLEHLENLLLGSSDPLKNAAYFGILFKTPPTYEELVSGTPDLEPIIKLNEDFQKHHSLSVDA